MRHSKWIAVVITIFNIALAIICGIIWLQTDRISPEFKFRISELVYKEDTTKPELLEGITASDNRDGDVTDRIVIEKIIKSKKENNVVVFYAVSDKAGNVVKISRIFPASFAREEAAEEQVTAEQADIEPEAEQTAEPEAQGATEEVAEEDTTETSAKKTGEESAEESKAEAAETDEEETDSEEANATENDTQAAAENTGQQEADGSDSEAAAGAAPVLTLKVSEVTTKLGVAPAWVDVIGTLSDDTDDYGTLFSRLNVSKYDINTVGDYKVSLTVTDSNKNTSKPVTLTIHVK